MWAIRDNQKRIVTDDELIERYPEIVAYDESGFPVDLNEGMPDPDPSDEEHARILFWACEAESVDDDGSHTVAEALWEEEK